MKPVDFPAANTTIAKLQREYLPLRAHVSREGVVTSCWAMSWPERLRALITGRIYCRVMTFRQPLQPLLLDTECHLPDPSKGAGASFPD